MRDIDVECAAEVGRTPWSAAGPMASLPSSGLHHLSWPAGPYRQVDHPPAFLRDAGRPIANRPQDAIRDAILPHNGVRHTCPARLAVLGVQLRRIMLTRRTFGTLLAAGAASRLVSAPPQDTNRKIGYCIVGLGHISMQHFMPGTRISKRSRVTAIVSGHRDKAEKWRRITASHSSIYGYENYDAIAENKDIDAVYIALPNSMHAEYTIRAAKAGKHVLSEKPMATSVADAQAMVDACKGQQEADDRLPLPV